METTSVATGGGSTVQIPSAGSATTAPASSPPASTTPSSPGLANPPTASPTSKPTDWAGSLSEKVRGLVETKGWTGVEAMAQSYEALEKHLGADPNSILRVPSKADDAEGYKTIFSKLGRPDKPEGYGLTADAGGDPTFVKGIAEAFHEGNLTTQQANAVRAKYNEVLKNVQATRDTAALEGHRKQITDLTTEWGTSADMNFAIANQAARSLGLAEGALLDPKTSISGAQLVKLMQQIGSSMGESKFVGGTQPGAGLNRAQALQQKDAFFRDEAWKTRYFAGGKVENDQMWAITQALAGGDGR